MQPWQYFSRRQWHWGKLVRDPSQASGYWSCVLCCLSELVSSCVRLCERQHIALLGHLGAFGIPCTAPWFWGGFLSRVQPTVAVCCTQKGARGCKRAEPAARVPALLLFTVRFIPAFQYLNNEKLLADSCEGLGWCVLGEEGAQPGSSLRCGCLLGGDITAT